jgi:hypothetical protein
MRSRSIYSSLMLQKKSLLRCVTVVSLFGLVACSGQRSASSAGQPDVASQTPSGYVDMKQV